MDEMLFRNELFNPSMAVPIIVTVTMPMTMPSVVSTERSLFARMALHEMLKPSRSSVKKFIGENETRTSNIEHPTPNIESRRAACCDHWMFDVGCSVFGVSDYLSSVCILPCNPFIARNQPVADADDATGLPGDIFLVRYHNDRMAAPGKLLEQRHDFRAGLGIKISRRLVGQQN